jgi:RimJ/RimL family protein N-acetyltransferase
VPIHAPERLETPRLVLRRPVDADAAAIFERYASDPDVTTFLAWPTHRDVADTRQFIAFSDAEWSRWPAGPYLIELRDNARLIGSTGFAFETPARAATGYVLAKDAWGHGYATEALSAIVALAPSLGLCRLHAGVHPDHRASRRVLEKCGFLYEARQRRYSTFPNSGVDEPVDALCYARVW